MVHNQCFSTHPVPLAVHLLHTVQGMFYLLYNEPHREKTGFLHMRKQRRRSASR